MSVSSQLRYMQKLASILIGVFLNLGILAAYAQGNAPLSKSDIELINRGLVLRQQAKQEAAALVFDRCKHIENASDSIASRVCEVYNSNNQSAKALQIMDVVVKRIGSDNKRMIAAGHPSPLSVRADCYNSLGRYDEAVADELRLAALFPSMSKMLLVKAGDIRRREKKYAEALALFDIARKKKAEQDDVLMLISRGSCLQALGKWDEAIANYTMAIKQTQQPGRTNSKAQFWAAATSYGERAKCYEHLKQMNLASADRRKQEEMGRAVEDELFGTK